MTMETNNLSSALAKAQGQMGKCKESGKNTHFNSTYSTYEDLMECARKPLSDNGLSVLQYLDYHDGFDFIVTILKHAAGEEVVSRARVHVKDATDIQKTGSFMTYVQRYNLAGMCGISANLGSDDDGNSISLPKRVLAAASQQPKSNSLPDVSATYPATGNGSHVSQPQINLLINWLKGNKEKENEICKKLKIDSLVHVPRGMCTSVLGFLGHKKAQEHQDYVPWDSIGVLSHAEQTLNMMMNNHNEEYESLPF